MSKTLKQQFWDRMDDVQAGMLEAENSRIVPMSHYADKEEGVLWFITATGTEIEAAARSSARATHVVADPKAHLYARVAGTLTEVQNRTKLDQLWSPVADAWFEGGKDDPDVRLIRFQPDTAEVWATTGAAGFMYEIAKANLTDAKPDMGDHGTIRF